ncbi:MAG: hypothetical protein QG653_344 [Patescibacteria group bacterium]|nr:hypothetical protein [Patescibacteria group bacterium]
MTFLGHLEGDASIRAGVVLLAFGGIRRFRLRIVRRRGVLRRDRLRLGEAGGDFVATRFIFDDDLDVAQLLVVDGARCRLLHRARLLVVACLLRASNTRDSNRTHDGHTNHLFPLARGEFGEKAERGSTDQGTTTDTVTVVIVKVATDSADQTTTNNCPLSASAFFVGGTRTRDGLVAIAHDDLAVLHGADRGKRLVAVLIAVGRGGIAVLHRGAVAVRTVLVVRKRGSPRGVRVLSRTVNDGLAPVVHDILRARHEGEHGDDGGDEDREDLVHCESFRILENFEELLNFQELFGLFTNPPYSNISIHYFNILSSPTHLFVFN